MYLSFLNCHSIDLLEAVDSEILQSLAQNGEDEDVAPSTDIKPTEDDSHEQSDVDAEEGEESEEMDFDEE